MKANTANNRLSGNIFTFCARFQRRGYAAVVVAALFFLMSWVVLDVHDAFSEEVQVLEHLGRGKRDFDTGRYAEAEENLSVALREGSLLEDYVYYYLSEVYHLLGEHDKSLRAVQSLIEKHPGSPMMKKARMNEIREAEETEKENTRALFESYLKDYPGDDRARYLFALYQRKAGEEQRAEALFRKVYIGAGPLAQSAYDELKGADIAPSELVERALNLMKRYAFEDAEQDLRRALNKDDGSKKRTILKNLGRSLFRQKKYRQAAEIFRRVDDTFYQARSLYRAGDQKNFDRALKELQDKNDKRAGQLLVAVAADKRREQNYEHALEMYRDIIARYPSEEEDALWGIGWTYYVSGDYSKAADAFSRLNSKYDDPKYLYWTARSIELGGKDPAELFQRLMDIEKNYYSALVFIKKGKGNNASSSSGSEKEILPPAEGKGKFRRVEVLQAIGMRNEAVMELKFRSKQIETPEDFLYVITKLQEFEEYRGAASLAERIPYSATLHRFWYPLAYWKTVEEMSNKYSVDPFVILSVIREESRYDVYATSPAGARGLMQIMPQTAYRLDRRLGLGIQRTSQIYDVKKNIHLGTYYLKSLLNEFNSIAHVLAAYNAGERAVRKWSASIQYRAVDEFVEDIPYSETRNYVKKVMTSYFQYEKYSPVNSGKPRFDFFRKKY